MCSVGSVYERDQDAQCLLVHGLRSDNEDQIGLHSGNDLSALTIKLQDRYLCAEPMSVYTRHQAQQ